MCTSYYENEETLNTEGRTYIVLLYILCGVVVTGIVYTYNDKNDELKIKTLSQYKCGYFVKE